MPRKTIVTRPRPHDSITRVRLNGVYISPEHYTYVADQQQPGESFSAAFDRVLAAARAMFPEGVPDDYTAGAEA